MDATNIFSLANIITALISFFVMTYAAVKHRTGRPIYVLIALVCLYYICVYLYIVCCAPALGATTAMLVRAPLSILLAVPTILYLLRDVSWTHH